MPDVLEELRDRHAAWQLMADRWKGKAEKAGQPIDAESEAIIRDTLDARAAAEIEALRAEVARLKGGEYHEPV